MFRRLTGLLTVGCVLLAGAFAVAQESTKKEIQPPVSSSAAVGKHPGEGTNPPDKNEVAPPMVTRRGAFLCDITLDNRTPWSIHRVYIDDRYWGAVGRYGDSIARDVGTGRTKVYAEADFTDGTTRYWGPQWFDCQSYATYSWTLR